MTPPSPPLLSVCWRVSLFSMSPPSPCSPSNLSLKTSFLPFIIFFFLHTSAAASRGLAMAGPESHVISAVAVAWEKKREVCLRTCFLAQLGGQRSAPISSSSHKRANSLLLGPFPLFAGSTAIFPFFFALWPPGLTKISRFKAWGWLRVNMHRCGY